MFLNLNFKTNICFSGLVERKIKKFHLFEKKIRIRYKIKFVKKEIPILRF